MSASNLELTHTLGPDADRPLGANWGQNMLQVLHMGELARIHPRLGAGVRVRENKTWVSICQQFTDDRYITVYPFLVTDDRYAIVMNIILPSA